MRSAGSASRLTDEAVPILGNDVLDQAIEARVDEECSSGGIGGHHAGDVLSRMNLDCGSLAYRYSQAAKSNQSQYREISTWHKTKSFSKHRFTSPGGNLWGFSAMDN